jgi:hypothetical protein
VGEVEDARWFTWDGISDGGVPLEERWLGRDADKDEWDLEANCKFDLELTQNPAPRSYAISAVAYAGVGWGVYHIVRRQ